MRDNETMKEGMGKATCCFCAYQQEDDWKDTVVEIACHGATLLVGFSWGCSR